MEFGESRVVNFRTISSAACALVPGREIANKKNNVKNDITNAELYRFGRIFEVIVILP